MMSLASQQSRTISVREAARRPEDTVNRALRTPNPTTLVHRSAAAPSTRPNLNRPEAAARAGPVDYRMRVVGPRAIRSVPSRLCDKERDPYFRPLRGLLPVDDAVPAAMAFGG